MGHFLGFAAFFFFINIFFAARFAKRGRRFGKREPSVCVCNEKKGPALEIDVSIDQHGWNTRAGRVFHKRLLWPRPAIRFCSSRCY